MEQRVTPSRIVLVVEDEWILRMAISDQLTDEGCLVLEASSGEDAFAYLNSKHVVDVLFTDLRLGGRVNGWDVAEAFRENDPHIGVIYTSGRRVEPRRDVSRSLFFDKPYNPAEIGEACLELAKQGAGKRLAERV